ncbi:unnamed protein product [Rhizophagus irregularis]|uniref:HTH CENPB-type domain-containing protein n=1 Tax=Rhizophagus irregularis TaxID=588596 RepID=A0A916DZX9_9GLOM|nr:unnamed protein product [Rhizophagus irregularis]
MSTKRKRVNLSAGQKREICEMKERDLRIQNVELAQKYNWPQLEDALGLWVDNALNTKQDIDGNILKMKASYFAEQFSIEDFHHSEGWLGGFKKRHGLRQFKKQGEAESAPSAESIERDHLALQQFLTPYNPEDIWNGDETGLFWKMEPSRVLARNSLSGHKKEKSRVIIFCATNATDETQEKLDSIDVKFLPPNTTTKLQPCDAGIIHSFKCHYKRLFLQNRINAYDDVQDGIVEELADYTIYDALQNAAKAWSMVTSQTISNCWKKTGILPQSDEFEEFSDDNDSVLSDSFDIEINELEMLISQLPKSDLNAYEYLHIEDEIPEGGLTDHEIVDTIRNANREEENVVDEIELTHIMEKISPTEVEKAIDKTIRFLYEQGPEFGEVNEELKILRRLHKKVKVLIVKNLKQVDLHYFRYDNVI